MTVERIEGRALLHIGKVAIFSVALQQFLGEVLEKIEMPAGVNISGLESDGNDRFFCGGGKTGKRRAVRRPKRA